MTNYTLMPAQSDKFVLSMPMLPTSSNLTDNVSLTLHMFETIIPGISFTVNNRDWQGYITKDVYSALEFEDLTASYVVDEDYDNWKLLYNWMTFINNNNNIAGNSKENYSIDASLIMYDNFIKPIMKLNFVGLFPSSLDAITLSHRDGEEILTGTCTFTYDYYEIKE